MKVKMKFDKKAALGYVVEYGERAVFACVVLCFLFFVYKSFARERYEKEPQDLFDAAKNASAAIERTEPSNEEQKIKNYLETIEELSDPNEEHYATTTPLNSPIFPPRRKRGEPELFPVEALRGTPGVGRFEQSMRGGVGGTGGMRGGGNVMPGQEMEPLGSRWVMLTGLVDLKKQTKAFYECYKDVGHKRSGTDRGPRYLGFWVERAEVRDSENAEDLQWKRPYKSFAKAIQECGGITALGASDGYVDPGFTQYITAFPLPKRSGQDWDESVAHPPEIPLLGLDDTVENDREVEKEEEVEEDPDDLGAGLDRSRSGRGMGARDMATDMGRRPGVEGGRGAARPGNTGRPVRGTVGKELSPYILFRFIDLNVEPGKQYKYRVRLGFYNPNFGIEPRHLIPELQQLIEDDKNLESRKKSKKKWKEYIKSPWSEPSDVVAMPRDDQLLLAEVTPARRVGAEPEAKVMAIHWDMQNGVKVSGEFEDIRRGKVANFLSHKISKPAAARPMAGRQPGMGGLLGTPGGVHARPPMGGGRLRGDKIDFKTECLVLDIRGGKPFSRKNRDLTEPGEILLLDPDGNLVVKNDVDDFDQYRKQKFPPKQNPRMLKGRGGMGGPGMGGPGRGRPGLDR